MTNPMLAFLSLPGGAEWIIILVIAVLIFGRRLPEIARGIVACYRLMNRPKP